MTSINEDSLEIDIIESIDSLGKEKRELKPPFIGN